MGPDDLTTSVSTVVGWTMFLLHRDTSAPCRNFQQGAGTFEGTSGESVLEGLQLQAATWCFITKWEGSVRKRAVDKRAQGPFCSSDGAQEPFLWWGRTKAWLLVSNPGTFTKYISRVRKSLLKYKHSFQNIPGFIQNSSAGKLATTGKIIDNLKVKSVKMV